jgi:very-short-patch-repair endonuclease
MDHAAPPLDALLATGPLRVSDARRAGLPAHRLRSARIATPFRGVRTADPPHELADACRALLPLLHPSVAFSHVTALRLLGVEVPWQLAADERLHVVTRAEAERPRVRGVVGHRSRQDGLPVVAVGGLPVAAPAHTFVHVAPSLRVPADIVALGDSLLRRERPLTTVRALRAATDRTRKVKGIATVRAAVEHLRAGTDSTMESRARMVLVEAGLPCPEVNQVVRDPAGGYVKRVDMLYPQWRVAIEYDGDQHRTDQAQWREDVRARRLLESLGWTVVVVVADDVRRDPRGLVRRVRAAIAARS